MDEKNINPNHDDGQLNNDSNPDEGNNSGENQNDNQPNAGEDKKVDKNIVNELIYIKRQKKELEEALKQKEEELKKLKEDASSSAKIDSKEKEIEEVVKSIIQKQEEEKAKNNYKKAFERFIAEHKEFHPENDPTGIKREILEKKLSQFNLSGLKEENDFYSIINDAYRLVGGESGNNSGSGSQNPYASTPVSENEPPSSGDSDITPEEKKLLERTGWSKEKLKEWKKKNPQYIESLLSYVK